MARTHLQQLLIDQGYDPGPVDGIFGPLTDRALADFDKAQRETLAVVLAQREGATPAAVRREIDRVDRIAADMGHVELAREAAARAKAQAGEKTIVVVPLELEGSQDELANVAVDMRDELDVGQARAGVEPHLVGQQALWAGMQDLSKEDLESAEKAGFPIVLLILLAVFGSLAAASLPLALGFGSVFVTGAAIFFLSQATEMSVFVTNVASMIGIGVAVDYSLFVLARNRGNHHYHTMYRSLLTPVCSPDLLHGPSAIRTAEDLRKHKLLYVYTAEEDWRIWLAAAGVKGIFHSDELPAVPAHAHIGIRSAGGTCGVERHRRRRAPGQPRRAARPAEPRGVGLLLHPARRADRYRHPAGVVARPRRHRRYARPCDGPPWRVRRPSAARADLHPPAGSGGEV